MRPVTITVPASIQPCYEVIDQLPTNGFLLKLHVPESKVLLPTGTPIYLEWDVADHNNPQDIVKPEICAIKFGKFVFQIKSLNLMVCQNCFVKFKVQFLPSTGTSIYMEWDTADHNKPHGNVKLELPYIG